MERPTRIILDPVIGPFHRRFGVGAGTNTGLYSGNAAWPTANKAIYCPINLPAEWVFDTFGVAHGSPVSAAVDFDIGLYDANGNKIVTTGSTAANGSANTLQTISVGPIKLLPGAYWLAMSCEGGSNDFDRNALGSASWAFQGVREEANAFPLPDPISLATATTLSYMPAFAMFRQGYPP